MSQAKTIGLSVLTTAIGALVVAWVLSANGVISATITKADSAVTQEQYNALSSRVQELEEYKRDFERFRSNIQGFRQDVKELSQTLSEVGYKLRSTVQTMDGMAQDISYLKSRQEPLWDAMNILCAREGITCPMRNAMWSPGNPYPQPRHFDLRYAYHKAPAASVELVDDTGEGA
tara:strand:+ start:4012 stop:4536 length:525 start_codon:yes stop_codon:yes gene_type:complete